MSLERQIRKIMANSVGISEKVQRKMQLKNKTNFDFRLFDPEDSPGSDKANDDMNKEIVKASKMKDKNTAFQHMMKIQKKHSKHGATDTEPREMIRAILDRVFGESVNFEENFMDRDCDICGEGSPCTCGESQEIEEKLDDKDIPAVKKIIGKLKGASKAHAGQAKSLEKEIQDDVEEDIRNLPKDKQRALQHADKTAKPKSKVSLAPTPGIKTEETNLDEAFEQFFTEGYEGEVKKVLDKKGIDAYFKNGKLMVSKRDKGMVIQILKRQDFDMPKIQVEEIQMESNRFGLSVSLVDAVADVLAGKRPVDEMKMKKDDEDEKKKAKKAPVTDKDDDGDGMDPVGREDGDIDNDGDKDDSDKFLAKRRKAIGKAMKKDGGAKEPVDTKPKMDEEKQKKEDATPVKEGDMTDAQMKRREEIVKELKKKSADFESRYGDKADAVMYATATKMAMKGK